jgi:hypothetical protein
MSSKGNRSNPNHTRTAGHADTASPAGEHGGDASGATNQESRDHHKHNNAGQSGHKPQHHNPAEEKR